MNEIVLFISVIGLYFFALEVFRSSFQEEITLSAYRRVSRILQKPWTPFVIGLVVSFLFRSPLPVILGSLGFVHHQILYFDHAYQTMLGACLGAALATFMPHYPMDKVYLILLALCIAIFFLRPHPVTKSFSKAFAALLFLFFCHFGLQEALSNSSLYIAQLERFAQIEGNSLGSQLLGVLYGTCMGVFELSSEPSTLFRHQPFLNFQDNYFGKISLLLGAQIGETLTILIACLVFRREAKRVGYAFLATRALGVLLTIFFFPIFVKLSDILIPGDYKVLEMIHLKSVHVFFNFMFVLTWGSLGMIIIRLMQVLAPARSDSLKVSLSPGVWKILVNSPAKSFREANIQMNRAKFLVKQLYDECNELLLHPENAYSARPLNIDFLREFKARRECMHYLILQNRGTDAIVTTEARLNLLRQVALYEHLFENLQVFYRELYRGLLWQKYHIPDYLQKFFSKLQKSSNELWVLALQQKALEPKVKEKLESRVKHLEKASLFCVRELPNLEHQNALWLVDCIHRLREISNLLIRIIPENDPNSILSEAKLDADLVSEVEEN